ncbi:FeMo cofactor biosynthesis protein NifB [Methanothermobacter tenebrarum]|uniref:FeMo cofactor biosynthesis protein NifB n=1 Tax=Methanothermobacter tenebrarum TaxID=680118 RepID=A0A328PD74_9EURY|nr:FeMo cofactor biosynthesis protein NifB [Methanothermobacter tenebrarum]MBC7118601.1 radical SAM protein [Methanobacteriaceae archaeon]NPV64203.1 radical SAM protein [Methanobacteriaceae archaeon]RAO79820.1 nitrogenase molybdenum-iron cofactor biosynthesis protein [Methanothermobacter tenebrarum]
MVIPRQTRFAHITKAHPCFNEKIHDKVGRIHLPIAPKCNIHCKFCTREISECEMRPGVTARVMSVDDAIKHVEKVTKEMPISVIGVAGPGDALANEETFEFFKRVNEKFPDLIKCMSTNGLLLPEKADELAKLGVKTITVTVNAIDPEIGEKIYSHVIYKGKVYKGREAFKILSKNQLEGIEKAAKNGIIVKVNTVLIPGLNDKHITDIAREVKKRGASLMNIIPLIPLAEMKDYPRPTCAQIEKARAEVEKIIPVFRACMQCRADAYGIPGKKDKHLDITPASHY